VSESWVAVGRLIRPRGNRGELVAEIYSSQPGRAEKLKDVMLDADGRRRPSRVERVWHHQERTVLKFAGIDSISDAEAWAGADLLVPEAERASPAEGEYSHADLIGCSLVGEQPVGTVVGVEDYGGSPLLRVLTRDGEADGREILVPFTRSICLQIDVKAKIIRVELPEGLLDL
jgi:16S rRNA processing protein RimM